jgi:hypothetical protein
MSKINVKIPTASIVKALEERLAKVKSDYAKQDELEAKFQKKLEAWKKEIGKWAFANFSKAQDLRTNYRAWNKTLNVDFDIIVSEKDFPAEPVRDYEQIHESKYREQVEEMENALRILSMTTDTEVSTSTYNAICRYL